MIAFHCDKCGERLEFSANMCGQSISCPRCHEWVAIPVASESVPFQLIQGNSVNMATNGKAIACLVLGLCGFCIGLAGIVGVIFGILAKKEIDKSGGRQKGEAMAVWGIVLGASGFALNLSWAIYKLANE